MIRTVLLLFCVLLCCVANAADGGRPNILFIMPDQLRAQALGCMGNTEVKTPNIDALAAQGILFTHTFANCPVCCPARATLLTGKYPHKHGLIANDLRLRESETTFVELLKAEGYRTGFIGKWHLDGGKREPGFVPPGERRQGFDFWAAHECSHQHFKPVWFYDTAVPIRSDKFEPEALTDVAIDFLRRKSEQPFCLFIFLGPPHDPYGAPEKYMQLYDRERLTFPPNWRGGVPNCTRRDLHQYYAAISCIDEQVGRLAGTLKELGLEENTIVLFSSDHGDMLGSHGAQLKRKPWEESIRVPGIVRYPAAIKNPRKSDALFSHIDFAPTLLSLCGVKVPAGMQGHDFAPIIQGKADENTAPQSVLFQIFVPFAGDGTLNPWRGVRTSQYMYARTEAEPWVLYDVKNDPYELKNLAADPASETLRQQMEAELTAQMQKAGDAWSNNSTEPVEDAGRLFRFETFYTIDEYLKWAKEHPDLAPKK